MLNALFSIPGVVQTRLTPAVSPLYPRYNPVFRTRYLPGIHGACTAFRAGCYRIERNCRGIIYSKMSLYRTHAVLIAVFTGVSEGVGNGVVRRCFFFGIPRVGQSVYKSRNMLSVYWTK